MGLMKKLAEKATSGGLTPDERRFVERLRRPPDDPLDCLLEYERGEVRDDRQTATLEERP